MGSTIGIDIKKQEYCIRFVFVLDKETVKNNIYSTSTNFKDYKQAEGRARF
jgi:hypothetical protein